jgi:hypothetical protein
MAKSKRKYLPQKLFAKLVRVARKRFDKDPATKKSYQDVQKWVSANLYPLFKGENPNRVKIADIESAISAVLSGQKPKGKKKVTCGDVFSVPDGDILELNWWELEDTLFKLDPIVQARVNAEGFMVSSILPAGDLYSDSSTKEAVNLIRENQENLSGATWVGVRKLKSNKKNDGSPCNYFIDFVLSTDGNVDYSDEVFGEQISLTPEQEAEREARREKVEKIKRERAKARRAKKRKRPKTTKKSKPQQESSPDRQKQLVRALELLRKDYDDGIFTKAEYKKERSKLIAKFEEGGEIL